VVKSTRLNVFVPVPQVSDLEELNPILVENCREDLKRRLRGKSANKAKLLAEDREAFLPHPAGGFDPCRKLSTRANSLSLVRFDQNDYSGLSGPVAYLSFSIFAAEFMLQFEFAMLMSFDRKVLLVDNISVSESCIRIVSIR